MIHEVMKVPNSADKKIHNPLTRVMYFCATRYFLLFKLNCIMTNIYNMEFVFVVLERYYLYCITDLL